MLRAGNWRFLVGGQEFDCEPAIMRRVYTRGLLSYREGVGSMPRIGVSHWDLADALLRRRALISGAVLGTRGTPSGTPFTRECVPSPCTHRGRTLKAPHGALGSEHQSSPCGGGA